MRKTGVAALAFGLLASCASASGVQAEDAWARASAGTQDTGVVYMTLIGGDEDDHLTGASVGTSIAASVELHETMEMTGDDGTGMMHMQPAGEIAVSAGKRVSLEPGGYHFMLVDLAEPLVDGSTFDLTLNFEHAGELEVLVEVRED